MEFSANGKKTNEKKSCYKFFVFISISLLRSSYFTCLRPFQILLIWTNLIQMPSLNRYEKVIPFMEFSVNGKKELENLSYKFFVIISFALLRSSYFNFLRSVQIILFLTNLTQMPSLNWYQKVTLFMEISVKGKKQLKKFFLQVFRDYFNCIATVKLLQFLTFTSDPSVLIKLYSNALFNSTRENYSFRGIFRKW